MNVARDGSGRAPSPKTCSSGAWLKSINESGEEHETVVIVDDRDHDKGNMFRYVTAPVDGVTPGFPILFVLDHNGKILNKKFLNPGLSAVEKLVEEQEEIYDKALKKALPSKPDSEKPDSKDSEKKDSEKKDSDDEE